MKNTSIYTWYKKVTNLVCKNIEEINVHGLNIEIHFMDLGEDNKSVNVYVSELFENGEEYIYGCENSSFICSIANYLEENVNKKNFENFKNFLENIETLDQSFEDENNDKE